MSKILVAKTEIREYEGKQFAIVTYEGRNGKATRICNQVAFALATNNSFEEGQIVKASVKPYKATLPKKNADNKVMLGADGLAIMEETIQTHRWVAQFKGESLADAVKASGHELSATPVTVPIGANPFDGGGLM